VTSYRALSDPECGDCWLVVCDDEADPGIVAMCGQQRDADIIASALNDRGAVDRIERLESALRWYANGNNFPHPDYAAKARAALYADDGGQ